MSISSNKIICCSIAICLMINITAIAESAIKTVEESNVITLDIADDYSKFLDTYKNTPYPDKRISLQGGNFSGSDYKPEIFENYENSSGQSVKSEESGYIEWSVDIAKSDEGFYNLSIDYYPIQGKSSSIIRSVEIDGKLQFNQARSVVFNRLWIDESNESGIAITKDPNGNDIRPIQIESPKWYEAYVKDSSGYIGDPLYFYFSQGTHTIRLTAIQEPFLVNSVNLSQYKTAKPYDKYMNDNKSKEDYAKKEKIIKIQGESGNLKSDAMIVPISDRSSCATEPNDAAKLKLNSIGGTNWQQSGQWISWNFKIEKSGFYNIGIKALQSFLSGQNSHRRVYIDGAVPFEEIDSTAFVYNSKWMMNVLGGAKNPYGIYLEQGDHTLVLEVTLGEMANFLKEANDVLIRLNAIYREILMLTGPIPDTKRDYQFHLAIPDTIKNMDLQMGRLKTLYNDIVEQTKMNGSNVQILFQLFTQLDTMVKNPKKIADKFSSFQNNINTLGSWINDTKNQPLSIDYIVIAPADTVMPAAGASVFAEMKYQVESFLASFYVDYDKINYNKTDKNVSVWVGSGLTGGRDQAQVLKTLSDNNFTTKSGISVELQLVAMGALLPATLSGKGPDVALSLSSGEAANYSFRNAAVNMAEFPDFNVIKGRFFDSAMTPLTFEGKVFGLPETQTFPMLFYRKDILLELGIGIPSTWQDVINMLPILQKKQLEFGLPPVGTIGSTLTMFSMLLYQYGGELYSSDGAYSKITTPEAFDSFSFLTSLYTDYQLPKQIDFINRFRMGSVPIGIADYSMFNQLSVFAPELNGLWGFTTVPGVMEKDGKINRTVAGGVYATIILEKSKNKDYSWEFVKWWTQKDTQVQFGRQLESIMGVAARYPTANIEASIQIPWAKENYDALLKQWKSVKGIPEVPGSYFTPRNIDFAFRNAVYNFKDIDDCLTTASKNINAEINKKRKEFGMKIYSGTED